MQLFHWSLENVFTLLPPIKKVCVGEDLDLQHLGWKRCLGKHRECPFRAEVLYGINKLLVLFQELAPAIHPPSPCCFSHKRGEIFAEVWYHQITIYLAKLGLTENCLVSFGNLYNPPKPLC